MLPVARVAVAVGAAVAVAAAVAGQKRANLKTVAMINESHRSSSMSLTLLPIAPKKSGYCGVKCCNWGRCCSNSFFR